METEEVENRQGSFRLVYEEEKEVYDQLRGSEGSSLKDIVYRDHRDAVSLYLTAGSEFDINIDRISGWKTGSVSYNGTGIQIELIPEGGDE